MRLDGNLLLQQSSLKGQGNGGRLSPYLILGPSKQGWHGPQPWALSWASPATLL